MEELNGHIIPATCPFSGESVELPVVIENQNNNIIKNCKPNLRVKVPQNVRLKNHMSRGENFDTLHSQIDSQVIGFDTKCTEKTCQLSVMGVPNRGDTPRTPEEVYKDAELFLKQFYSSTREDSAKFNKRIEKIKNEIAQTGAYELETLELTCGAKLAWRNASRCIGRIQWKKLQVFDCRQLTTASSMFDAICKHIKYATNKGNIRSAITVFKQRTDGKHDYRIWNPQLINYAGYVQEDGSILGDPSRVEFTEVCIRLGWKPPGTAWDILPIVISADGKDPEYFDLPRDLVMEIHIEHPEFKWFKDLGLRWYALPAISSMRLDCGGLEFTGTAFNGWYMGTEIGCRNFCDPNRYNYIEVIAKKMGLDTNSFVSLWKDRALVEMNRAVLYSYHRDNVSIVDHHSASEQFMKHLNTENKIRGGCPSDWIWIVPPMSASLTAVFHQEMLLYNLRPSYDYQESAWKTHQWTKPEHRAIHRKFHFKQIARAVKFTSKLFGRALSKRIKATILYASETGKSEQYAKELGVIFGHAFNAQVHCMSEYDMFSIEHETLLIIVTSTFGNGEPPKNGVEFAEHLFQMMYNEQKHQRDLSADSYNDAFQLPTPKTLMRTNSIMSTGYEEKKPLTRLESNKSSIIGSSSLEHIGPLSNICFAVFALGSSAYPKFCNFGKNVDKILGELGGERILEVACGDEICGQEQQFREWASTLFQVACEIFCLEDNDMLRDAKKALGSVPLTEETVRFGKTNEILNLHSSLEVGFKKQLVTCKLKEVKTLGDCSADRTTIFVDMETKKDVSYAPGDHVGVMSCNRKDIVESVLKRVKESEILDKPVLLQLMKETLTPTGPIKTWERHDRLPPSTIRQLYTRFLDITMPPSTTVLKYLAEACTDEKDKQKILELVTDSNKFDDWRHYYYPHLGEVLNQFPSCKPQASLLAALLPPLQPRFYSISSSPLTHPDRIHLTVSVVVFKTQNGEGDLHYGVCSNYLQNLTPDEEIYIFMRRAPSFHMPKNISAPLILVGPGSGIAPFRGFWHHRRYQMQNLKENQQKSGPIYLYFGCRTKGMDLYKEEKEQALADNVLTKVMLALSREENEEKKHVQTLLEETGADVARMLLHEKGHFYVCGDCKMAEDVQQKLKAILKKHGNMTAQDVEKFMFNLMDENRYHEDIFGITLRTAEVHSACRETARKSRSSSGRS